MLTALWMYLSKMKRQFEWADGCEFELIEDALVWNWENGNTFVIYIKDGDYVLDVYTRTGRGNELIMESERCYDYTGVTSVLEEACERLEEA